MSLVIVVSPYHLTSREPPALASLLLADRVVTLVPTPGGGVTPEGAHRAAATAPAFRRLVRSWEWAEELWRAGLIAGDLDGDDPAGELTAIAHEIADDPSLSPLRPLMREGVFDDPRAFLQAVGADVVKGGPDPGVSVPLACALDRLASRHRAWAARSPAVSVAQQAESPMGERLFALAIPVLVEAAARRILHAREVLRVELTDLRDAFEAVGRSAYSGERDPALVHELQVAARAYAAAFDAERDAILDDAASDETRALLGTVAITGSVLPADAVLRSSVEAAEAFAGGSPRRDRSAEDSPRTPARSRLVATLVIKAMGQRPSRR